MKLKCGVIGCGWIGKLKHIAYLANAENAEVTALCDVNAEAMESAVKMFHLENVKLYTDYRELCADANVEAVHVCTPNGFHYEMTMEAIRNGKHVFCEKPLATSVKEGLEMVEAADRAGVKLTLGHQRRFMSSVKYIRELVDQGAFGDVYYGKAMDARRRGVPTWGSYMDKEVNGGGIIFDGAPHALDLCMYMMNNFRPAAVQAKVGNHMADMLGGNPWGTWDPEKMRTVDDTALALITMENGAVIYLESAWILNMLGEANSALICGTKMGADLKGPDGGARINTIVNDKMVVYSPEYPQPPYAEPYISEAMSSDAQMADFVDAVLQDRDPFVKGIEGIPVLQIIEAAYASSLSGETVKITEHYI